MSMSTAKERRENTIVVKADPGYWLLLPVEEEAGAVVELARTPILAWQMELMEQNGSSRFSSTEWEVLDAVPVTLDGSKFGKNYILRPDGVVEVPDDTWFRNEADLLKHLQGQSAP